MRWKLVRVVLTSADEVAHALVKTTRPDDSHLGLQKRRLLSKKNPKGNQNVYYGSWETQQLFLQNKLPVFVPPRGFDWICSSLLHVVQTTFDRSNNVVQ